MYCKICGKKLDNNIDYCQECEQKHYKSPVDDKIIDDYNKEVQQKSINLSSQEKKYNAAK